MIRLRTSVAASVVMLSLALSACSGGTAVQQGPSGAEPEPPGPAPDETSQSFLRTAMFDFAADSMGGRAAGSHGHFRATRYLARRAQEVGLQPAGENGTYFQEVPIRTLTAYSDARVSGMPVEMIEDAIPIPPVDGFPHVAGGSLDGVAVVYGGRMLAPDAISGAAARDKVVVLGAGMGPEGPAYGIAPQILDRFRESAAVVLAVLDYAPPGTAEGLVVPAARLVDDAEPADGPKLVFVTTEVAERMIGGTIDETAPGTEGVPVEGNVGFRDEEPDAPTRNVIAVLPGSDGGVRDEYVVLSAHSDHIGPVDPVASHDSLRAYLQVVRPRGAEDPARPATAEESARIAEILDASTSNGAPRADSIHNGADDDASGSVALLNIGRMLAADPPGRSVLFVWHTAEEMGLYGAEYFTDHPTVPIEDFVANLNLDMVGRGGAQDTPSGGPAYLQLIGSRRLSTELGDRVEAVNREGGHGFSFDYSYDADGHPDNYYCRSDHYMYARYGIPVTFFSTGGHRDYHQLTDEPQYIDFAKLARVSELVGAVARHVADLDHALVVDRPVPDPEAPCQQ